MNKYAVEAVETPMYKPSLKLEPNKTAIAQVEVMTNYTVCCWVNVEQKGVIGTRANCVTR